MADLLFSLDASSALVRCTVADSTWLMSRRLVPRPALSSFTWNQRRCT